MDYLVVCLTAFAVAGLTLFSGFGLGTVLLPVFALFFPLPVAVTATAVVHLANNLFKLGLVGRHANREAFLRFGVPAALAAVAGAALLNLFAGMPPLVVYQIGQRECEVTLIKVLISVIIIGCAQFELVPASSRLSFDRKYLPLGGVLSGFFGGLSGNQGALRSAFLIKAGLTKEEFIGTGVVATVAVDVVRLVIYGTGFYSTQFSGLTPHVAELILAATLAALAGSFLAARLVEKVTLRAVQVMVGLMLVGVSLAMVIGLV